MLSQGWEIRATELTEEFDHEAYQARWGAEAIPLFALDDSARLHVRVRDTALEPGAGWTLISLLPDNGPEAEDRGGGEDPEPGNGGAGD